jgi:hypothetical protein
MKHQKLFSRSGEPIRVTRQDSNILRFREKTNKKILHFREKQTKNISQFREKYIKKILPFRENLIYLRRRKPYVQA